MTYNGGEFTSEFTISVTEEDVTAIIHELRVTPDQTEYVLGESLDITNWIVEAIYTDGTTRILESGEYEVSGYDPNRPASR